MTKIAEKLREELLQLPSRDRPNWPIVLSARSTTKTSRGLKQPGRLS